MNETENKVYVVDEVWERLHEAWVRSVRVYNARARIYARAVAALRAGTATQVGVIRTSQRRDEALNAQIAAGADLGAYEAAGGSKWRTK